MPLAAREDDAVATGHACDTTTNLATPGQTTVYIEQKLAARLGDNTDPHEELVGDTCVTHTESINGSSSTVYISGVLAARLGDGCDAGTITGSASDVYIG